MKKLMLKKMNIWIILVVFIFTAIFSMAEFNTDVQAAPMDFVLSHAGTKSLSKGDDFVLKLKMRTTSAINEISNIVIDFSGSGIARMKDNETQYFPSETVKSAENVDIGEILMVFTGDGSSAIMPVSVSYTLNDKDEKTVSVNLILDVEEPEEDDSGSGSVDTSKYIPDIFASVPNNLELSAGKTATVTMSLKNISTRSSAKDIIITPLYQDNSPFVSIRVLSEMPIKQLLTSATADVKFSVDVDKFAAEGVYPCTFKLTYTNAWGDEINPVERTVYIKVVNSQTNCNLSLQLPPDQNASAAAGGNFDLPIIIKNSGSLAAKEVKVSITGMSQETFTLSSGTGRKDFRVIYGNESYPMTYTLKASSSLKSGSYPISFVVDYVDEKGTAGKVEQQVWVPVAGKDGGITMLEIEGITPSKTTVKSGESFDVSAKIKNTGDYDIAQIKVSADGTAAMLPISQNLYVISNLKKGETRDITFKFQSRPDAERGGVPITIKAEPVDGGENSSIARAISVFLDSTAEGSKEAGKNVPKIIVSSYSSDPTLVKAGERFTLNMQFLNTHASKTVRNIKGSFVVTEASNETGSVFSPVESSNTFFIDSINPKGTCEWSLTLYTIPDAKSKTYTVTVSFEYEDDAGNPYKADELIGIPVYQPSRFETSEIMVPSEAYVGQPVYVSFEMYNMGKTDIYNVQLNVEGDFDAQPRSNYFGNFESGRREYFELNLIPSAPGETDGRIVFEYETASGEKQELVKEFSMNAMEMDMPVDGEFPPDGSMDPGMEGQNKGFFQSVWFYIILGVVVIGAVVAAVLIVRKRKKKEEFEF